MAFVRVQPDDVAALAAAVEILEASRRVDDPDQPPFLPELYRRWLRYGWDMQPAEVELYSPEAGGDPVGVLTFELPVRDNRHLAWAAPTVHPDSRRQGHGSAMMHEAVRRTQEARRTTMWVGGPQDDPAVAPFLARFGFHPASRDVRRKQWLAEVDHAEVDRLFAEAEPHARDYELVRMLPPQSDELMRELASVAASINDAPMGDLTFEPEVFDLDLMRDLEAARVGRQDRLYRVAARHRVTGELAGHTVVCTEPAQPAYGVQCDTAVARHHRGHRLGLLLKIDMMRWLAEVEPQLEVVETFNQIDNDFMIGVNEAIGYRLDRVFAMYELALGPQADEAVTTAGALVDA